MITPLEIQNKEFSKSFRGYDMESVDSFLDEIIEDYEKLYRENIELKDKINVLADQLRQYNTLEETLKTTLIVAQSTADEVTGTARQKAENIIEDAEIAAQKIKNSAKEDVRHIKNEYDHLKKEIFTFKTRYETFIEAQLMSLDRFYKEIEQSEEKKPLTNEEELTIDEIVIEEDLKEVDDLGA